MRIISIEYFTDNKEVKNSVLQSDKIRSIALSKAYKIEGYKDLTLKEKNKIYDKIVKEIKENII
jgi:hypothetical protein